MKRLAMLMLCSVTACLAAAPPATSVPAEVYHERQAELKRLCMQSKSELYTTLYLLADKAPAKWKEAEAGILKRIRIKRSGIAFFYMDIVLAYRLYAERFSPEARQTIAKYIEDTIAPGSFKYGCRFVHANDNWPLNAMSLMIIGGECIGRDDLVLEGISRLENFLITNRQLGMTSEYNSPTYNALSLYAVEVVADLAQSLRARVTARVAAERLWLETAHRYHHASRQLAAPHSRAYFEDTLGVRSAMFYTLYPLLPEPPSLDNTPFPAARHHYQTCPENSRIRHFFEPYHAAICLSKPYPYHVQGRKFRPFRKEGDDTWPGGFFDTVTYMTGTYAVGSAQRVFCGGHSTTPFQAHWVDSSDNRSNALFVRYRVDDAMPDTVGKMSHQFPENGIIHPVQHRNTTVVLYRPKLSWKRPKNAAPGVRALCASAIISLADQLDEVCVGSRRKRVDAYPCELRKPKTVLLRDGACYIAIHPLAVTDMGRDVAMRLERRDSFLVISLVNMNRTEPTEPDADTLRGGRNGFVIDLGDDTECADFSEFCRIAGRADIDDRVRDGIRTVHYRRRGRTMTVSQRVATHQYLARTFDGEEYSGPMLRTPHTIGTLGDRIELGDAVLSTRWGELKYLTVEPTTATYSVLYPFRWPFPLHLETPHGTLQSDGFRLGKIVYRPNAAGASLVIDCERAPRPLHLVRPPGKLTVIINDRDMSDTVKTLPDGRLEIPLPGNDIAPGMHAQIDLKFDTDGIVLDAKGQGHLRATLSNTSDTVAEEAVTVPYISGFVRHYGCGSRRVAQLAPGASKPLSWGLTGVPGASPAAVQLAVGAENAPTR